MSEFNENRVREIVRDEMHLLQIPERLVSIENKLDQKADKTDLEKLEHRLDKKIDVNTARLDAKIDSHKEQTSRDTKIIVGLIISLILLIIGSLIKKAI